MNKVKIKYDGMLVFNVPVLLDDTLMEGLGNTPVLGIVYSTSGHGILFSLVLEMYCSYLLWCEKKIGEGWSPVNSEVWKDDYGKLHKVGSPSYQWKIYIEMKNKLNYRLYEFPYHLEFDDNEVNYPLILSQSLLDRYGVSFIEDLNIKNNRG